MTPSRARIAQQPSEQACPAQIDPLKHHARLKSAPEATSAGQPQRLQFTSNLQI